MGVRSNSHGDDGGKLREEGFSWRGSLDAIEGGQQKKCGDNPLLALSRPGLMAKALAKGDGVGYPGVDSGSQQPATVLSCPPKSLMERLWVQYFSLQYLLVSLLVLKR